MASLESGKVNELVDVERGIISREIFVSEEIYRREQEQIFAWDMRARFRAPATTSYRRWVRSRSSCAVIGRGGFMYS